MSLPQLLPGAVLSGALLAAAAPACVGDIGSSDAPRGTPGGGAGSAGSAGAAGGGATADGGGGQGATDESAGAGGSGLGPESDAGPREPEADAAPGENDAGAGAPGGGGPGDDGGPCPCFDGAGTYCADAAAARAAAEGCLLPKAKKHPGDVLHCAKGVWRWDATCESGCKGGGTGGDACVEVGHQLPWGCGKKRACTAGNAEEWHHTKGSYSEHAFDFKLSPDTGVRAMRGGVVEVAKFETGPGDPCYEGCDDDADTCKAKCGDKANALTIRHADGTVAQYLHLNEAAAGMVKGQRVEQGELVAYSGNTGWSTGPHLHVMLMEKGCEQPTCQSIPMSFHGIGKPKAGKTYTSENCP